MKSMHNFSYKPDAMVAASLDTFLRTEWNGFLQRRDLYCSPYTMTADGMFILDHLPGFPQISLFTGGNGRAFKFSILLGRWAEWYRFLPALQDKCMAEMSSPVALHKVQ